jgi:NAD+ synthase (glutamine-hydrolysing)
MVAGVPIGVSICEDLWFSDGPLAWQAEAGARLLVNANASPYSRGRHAERLAVLAERTAETGLPLVYVNQVGGQDELVFDGSSVIVDGSGALVASAGQFTEEVLVADLEIDTTERTDASGHDRQRRFAPVVISHSSRAEGLTVTRPVAEVLDPVAEVYEALVLGTRDYLGKNGFSDAVIGLSGGIDSSLVAIVPSMPLGPSTSTVWPCPAVTRAKARWPMRTRWPTTWASTCNELRSNLHMLRWSRHSRRSSGETRSV